ncbi:MAG: restriction endonuclease [Betaproteobacteria bacterium]|nr:restriction endonuclease [Betaproteobacteria bacterium]
MTSKKHRSGVEFEELVSRVQRQIDPNSQVTHNELLTDRLGHQRQFDVVLRGQFAGQQILGVMECKDLSRNVGIQDVDAFITKCNDINANLKILVSSKKFSQKAIEKAKHYGVQTLSLLPSDSSEFISPIATKWYADIYFWKQISMQLHVLEGEASPDSLVVDRAMIGSKRVMDWFTNYLIKNHTEEIGEGWIVGIKCTFGSTQIVTDGNREWRCAGITFGALRACERKVRNVGWKGTGFFDWQLNQLKTTSNATLSTDAIPVDFRTWEDRTGDKTIDNEFLFGHLTVFGKSFEYCQDAIDLEEL